MTKEENKQAVLTGSIALNVFLVGAIITHTIMSWAYVTESELHSEIEKALKPIQVHLAAISEQLRDLKNKEN